MVASREVSKTSKYLRIRNDLLLKCIIHNYLNGPVFTCNDFYWGAYFHQIIFVSHAMIYQLISLAKSILRTVFPFRSFPDRYIISRTAVNFFKSYFWYWAFIFLWKQEHISLLTFWIKNNLKSTNYNSFERTFHNTPRIVYEYILV